MEVRIGNVEYGAELYVLVETENYRVLSSSLETWEDRRILQVELTKLEVKDAGKDNQAPVDNSGRQPECQCGICRTNREGPQGPATHFRNDRGFGTV